MTPPRPTPQPQVKAEIALFKSQLRGQLALLLGALQVEREYRMESSLLVWFGKEGEDVEEMEVEEVGGGGGGRYTGMDIRTQEDVVRHTGSATAGKGGGHQRARAAAKPPETIHAHRGHAAHADGPAVHHAVPSQRASVVGPCLDGAAPRHEVRGSLEQEEAHARVRPFVPACFRRGAAGGAPHQHGHHVPRICPAALSRCKREGGGGVAYQLNYPPSTTTTPSPFIPLTRYSTWWRRTRCCLTRTPLPAFIL